jgi:hypothetical protein
MLRAFLPVALLVCLDILPVTALDTSPKNDSIPKYWKIGAGLGLDFAQLLQINPRQGAGQNRIGIGGALTSYAKLKKDLMAWDNTLVWQFGVQKFGSGPLANGANIPFQKAIDEFRISSKLGVRANDSSQLFISVDFNLLSQITPTFQGTKQYPGNFLTDITRSDATPLAHFFSPATTTASIGVDFKPNSTFSIFYSAAGAKFIIVTDDDIARKGVHGNPVTKNTAGTVIAFTNVDAQIGSLCKINYANKFMDKKLTLTSQLILYSNYLRNPQNIDVDWNSQLSMTLIKNLQISLIANVFYDDDVRVQITDYSAPGGVAGLGKRVSFTQQLLLKYAINL